MIENLRTSVPHYDSAELRREWDRAAFKFDGFNELEIPCAMSMGTRRILFQVLRAMGARDVLEIGTYLGTSAAALAMAVSSLNGRVVSVDIKDVNAPDSYWSQLGRIRSPRELVDTFGVSRNVDFVTMDSVAFLQNSTRTFDFVCIDGWHEEEAVYKDIPLALSKLNPNGLIFLDDVQTDEPPPGHDVIDGPLLAIKRHLNENLGIELNLVKRTLEGEPTAVAFLTRKAA